MTFSILARDPKTGELGCAAATGNLAVGAWVLKADAVVGLVASQGFSVSTLWGDWALRALADGRRPKQTVDHIARSDTGAGFRQLVVLDATGCAAAWTGANNKDVKGHDLSQDLAVAGNWLANEKVLPALRRRFLEAAGGMAERLLHALDAAALAGSDARGVVSAAINVVSVERPPLNLRIDHSEKPIADLVLLYEKTHTREYREFLSRLPTLSNPQRG